MTDLDLQPPFDDHEQQRQADWQGLWVFLVTEVLLFGALFLSWMVCRFRNPVAFTLGAHQQDLWTGTLCTAVLLTSSLVVAFAVHFAEAHRSAATVACLLAAAGLGWLFVGLEGSEWWHRHLVGLIPGPGFAVTGPHRSALALYGMLYLTMTGLHGLHVLIGTGLLLGCVGLARRRRLHPITVTLVGLYWHFVDVVWVFLFPVFYLVGRP